MRPSTNTRTYDAWGTKRTTLDVLGYAWRFAIRAESCSGSPLPP